MMGLSDGLLGGELSHDRAAGALADLTDFDLHRHPHVDLLTRAWKLCGAPQRRVLSSPSARSTSGRNLRDDATLRLGKLAARRRTL